MASKPKLLAMDDPLALKLLVSAAARRRNQVGKSPRCKGRQRCRCRASAGAKRSLSRKQLGGIDKRLFSHFSSSVGR